MGIRKGLRRMDLRKYGHPENGGGQRRSAVGGGRRRSLRKCLHWRRISARCRTVKQALRGETNFSDVTKQLQTPMPQHPSTAALTQPQHRSTPALTQPQHLRNPSTPAPQHPDPAAPHRPDPDPAAPKPHHTTEIHNTNDLCNLHNHLASQRLTQRSYARRCGAIL